MRARLTFSLSPSSTSAQAMDIDVALDDSIAKKKAASRRGGRGGRGGRRGGPRPVSDRANVRDKYSGSVPAQTAASARPATASDLSTRIQVSNLPDDVSENQIRELFDTTVGRVKRLTLAYKADGKSSGVANIEFSKPGDAAKAFVAYNNRLIDQRRPMKVEILVDPSKIPPAPLSTRIAPVKKNENAATTAQASATGAESTAPRGRGRGRGGRRGGRKGQRPPATAEELDAEMDAFTKGES